LQAKRLLQHRHRLRLKPKRQVRLWRQLRVKFKVRLKPRCKPRCKPKRQVRLWRQLRVKFKVRLKPRCKPKWLVRPLLLLKWQVWLCRV
jgi:hypothetical protein